MERNPVVKHHISFLKNFWIGAFSDSDCFSFLVFHSVCDSNMRGKFSQNRLPSIIDIELFQTGSDAVKDVVRKNGDKYMCIASFLFLMKIQLNFQFRLYGTEGFFNLVQHGIEFPYLFFGKIGSVGSQGVTAGEPLGGFIFEIIPGDSTGQAFFLLDHNMVEPGNPGVFLLQPDDSFTDFLISLCTTFLIN